jgi:hypothetical protein
MDERFWLKLENVRGQECEKACLLGLKQKPNLSFSRKAKIKQKFSRKSLQKLPQNDLRSFIKICFHFRESIHENFRCYPNVYFEICCYLVKSMQSRCEPCLCKI